MRPSASRNHSLDDFAPSSIGKCAPALSMPQLSQHQQSELRQDSSRMQEILQDILRTLQDSPFVETAQKDVQSNFWETYNKAVKEHDSQMLERSNSDLDIVLIVSGLFSTTFTAFIIAMQPNPTTTLLAQLLQNMSANVAISPLTESAVYWDAATWSQLFAYTALSLCLLAAFGAVLGKQWLSHYKLDDIYSPIEDRRMYRQRKLDSIEAWNLSAVLQSFPVLLQISLLLFGIAISAFVWSQQGLVAVPVIVSTVFGVLFYTSVIITSLVYEQCPFQTPISTMIRLLWKRIKNRKAGSVAQPTVDVTKLQDVYTVTQSLKWIFKTSTDPEVISSAARMLSTIKWTTELQMPTICSRLWSTFRSCYSAGAQPSSSGHKRALACGVALNHIACNATVLELNPSDGSDVPIDLGVLWSHWHDVALPWGLEGCERSFIQYTTTLEDYHEDQARSALRLAIATGCPGFLKPTNVALIWDGVFDWSGDVREPEDFDWLVDFLVHFRTSSARDYDAMADALLALSAMRGLGSPSRRDNYLDSIIFSMEADKPSRLRHAALRAVFDARKELVNIAHSEEGGFREELLTKLSPALLTTTRIIAPQQQFDDDPDALFNPERDYFYLGLIFTLAKQYNWRYHLRKYGHIDRCITLLEHVIHSDHSTASSEPSNHPYYLVGALIRMNASDNYRDSDLADEIPELKWWVLLKGAWSAMWWNNLYDEGEALEALPDIVKYTLEALGMQASEYDSKSLVRLVDRIYEALVNGEAAPEIVSAVQNMKDALNSSMSIHRTSL